jgi:hypothetical protein
MRKAPMLSGGRLVPLVAALLLLGSAALGVTGAAAQAARPDPAIYLPTPDEIPPGFVYKPENDHTAQFPGLSLVLRWYERPTPAGAPGATTLLQTLAETADSPEVAGNVFRATAAEWQQRGFEVQPAPGLIGEEALVAAGGSARAPPRARWRRSSSTSASAPPSAARPGATPPTSPTTTTPSP